MIKSLRSIFPRPMRNRLFSVSASQVVELEKRGSIAIVSLALPEKLNMMTVAMGEQFEETMHKLMSDDNLRVVILTGKGKAFSAGGDLEFLRDRTKDTGTNNANVMRAFYRRFLSLRSLPVPVISAINGPAIGAGFCVALATDIRVTSPTTKLGLTFVGLGLHPGMAGTHFLPRLVGHQTASRLLLTGDVILGKEAAELGLVTLADDPLEHALEMATRIVRQNKDAVNMCTRSLRNQQDFDLERSLWREADCQAINYRTSVEEGINAIVEKRKPIW